MVLKMKNRVPILRAQAAAFAVYPDINTAVVAFAENADGSGVALEFSRSIVVESDDVRRGQDTYCICVEHGPTYYGGVERWTMSGVGIMFRLSAEAAKALVVPREFRVELVHSDRVEEVMRGLNIVLDETRGPIDTTKLG